MSHNFLGVDIGNSKSHAIIADETGRILAAATAGAGSWESVGWDRTYQIMHQIVGQAATAAGIRNDQITAAGFGLAGYDWPEDRAPYADVVRSLELGGPFEMINDALLGLYIGASERWGVSISAGTSCNCYGRDRYGKIGRVTGSSRLFGEYAGAKEIVDRAIQAVAQEWTRRGPPTLLSAAFVDRCGANDVPDLLAGLVRNRFRVTAADAPLVFELAASGDGVAHDIVFWAGQQLGDLASGVIRQLNFESLGFEVVLAGTVYDQNEPLVDFTSATIRSVAPGGRVVHLQAPPVLGGVILAIEQLGLNSGPAQSRLQRLGRQLPIEQLVQN